jgi:hypothetical protein
MELKDLKPSILDMSYDDALQLHLGVRAARLTRPAVKIAKRQKAESKKATSALDKAMSGMTEEEKLELLKTLEEECQEK